MQDKRTFGPGAPIKRHLFIDIDNLIEWEPTVEQRFYKAEKIAITGIEPGPAGSSDARTTGAWGSVLIENGLHRMWYSAIPDAAGHGEAVDHWLASYAESKDGIHWVKPDLKITGQKRFPGNNLLRFPGPFMSVVRALPGGPAKYIASGLMYPSFPSEPDVWGAADGFEFNGGGMYLFTSDDGFKWKQFTRYPLIQHGDVSLLHADHHRGRYLFFQKMGANHRMISRRSYMVMESKDAVKWEGYDGYYQWRDCFVPDDYGDLQAMQRGFHLSEHYALTIHQVGPLFVGIQAILNVALPIKVKAGQNPNGIFHLRTAFSHDGMHWRYPTGRPSWLEVGAPGEFDAGYFTGNSNLAETDEHQTLYYAGSRYAHGWSIDSEFQMRREIPLEAQRQVVRMGAARIRRDRFASLSATFKGKVDVDMGARGGDELTINARCPRGQVRVAIAESSDQYHLDPRKGESLPGYSFDDCVPFTGDAVRAPVRFKNASTANLPRDKRLVLRFEISSGEVFGYEWA